MGRHRQYVWGNEAAVRDDDTEVRLCALNALCNLGSLQRRCLQQVDACLGGHLRHRRRIQGLAATAPSRRACDDKGDLVGRRQQGPQRGDCGLGGTSKNNAHGRQFTALGRP